MSEDDPARKYVEQHGLAVADWLTRYIESCFGRVEMGMPRAVSEFGVVYEGHVIELDATEGHEPMMVRLKLLTTQSLPPEPKSCTLVWRTLPDVYARQSDWENDQAWPNIVRVRYRCHTVTGTTDFALNALKAAYADRVFDQPHHGH